jgi:hypothetical protein
MNGADSSMPSIRPSFSWVGSSPKSRGPSEDGTDFSTGLCRPCAPGRSLLGQPLQTRMRSPSRAGVLWEFSVSTQACPRAFIETLPLFDHSSSHGVEVSQNNILPTISPCHDMVESSRVLDTRRSRHGRMLDEEELIPRFIT